MTDDGQVDQFMTVADIAQLLKVPDKQVHRLIDAGRLHAINVGTGKQRARWRISLEAWHRFRGQEFPPQSGRHLRKPA